MSLPHVNIVADHRGSSMNFLDAAEKLAAVSRDLEEIKGKFPGVYSDFLNSLNESSTEDGEVEEFPITTKVPFPASKKTTTDFVREFLEKNTSASAVQIVDELEGVINSVSINKRRIVQQTLNNMRKRGQIEKNEAGEFELAPAIW